jgi:tryptophanyl-tRNA synthetase
MVTELRVIDMRQSTLETNDGVFELDGFLARQQARREEVANKIEENSTAVKESFADGIEKVLKDLRQKESETSDQPATKQDHLRGDLHKPK